VGGGLRSWKALDFKKWGLEPRSLTEVYAYEYCTEQNRPDNFPSALQTITIAPKTHL